MRMKFIFKLVLKKNKQKLKIGLRVILILLILTFSGVWQIKKDKPNLKLFKEKYPTTYADILAEPTEYVSLRITKCK